ncbi:F-box only protein 10 [Cyanocitta cristata]
MLHAGCPWEPRAWVPLGDAGDCRPQSSQLHTPHTDLELKSLQQELQQDKEAQPLASSPQGCIVRQCLSRMQRESIHLLMRAGEMGRKHLYLITDSNVHSSCEVRLDIRKGAKPLVLASAGLHVQGSEVLDVVAKGIATSMWVLQGRADPHHPQPHLPQGPRQQGHCHMGLHSNGSHGDSSSGIVTKNRIQSFQDYGIALFDGAKGLVQENFIFQETSKKSILQLLSKAEDCTVRNNVLLIFKNRGGPEHHRCGCELELLLCSSVQH